MTDSPSRTRAARHARGLRRLEAWLPEASVARLDELCQASGQTRPEQLAALIDARHAARHLKDEARRGKRGA